MKHEKLNKLAVTAQNGCENSYQAILSHFVPIVYDMSERNWHRFDNQTQFEQSCFVGIKAAIRDYDITKGNFSPQVMWRFKQALSRTIKRTLHKRRGYEIHSLDFGGSDEMEEREVEDVLARVDDDLLANEKIAFLAEGDPRKLAILIRWSHGYYNDSETSALLAKQMAYSYESNRKFIQRFRLACQKSIGIAL